MGYLQKQMQWSEQMGSRFLLETAWARFLSKILCSDRGGDIFTFDDGGGSIANPRNFSYVSPELCSSGIAVVPGIGFSSGSTDFGSPRGEPTGGFEVGLGLSVSTGCGKFSIARPRRECCKAGLPDLPQLAPPANEPRPNPTIGPRR